ncbi:MAG: hypothetical protein JW787_06325 [Sedimentisphaerales bacterium]|nr:hypothetical protein [Sedimentisphaerales bacterium]
MEEIRGRDQFAIAATGGNLFSRICRLIGKDSSEKNSLSWIPALTVILLLIALAIPTTIAFTSSRNVDPNNAQIEKMLIDGFRENRDKFKCGILAWTKTTINDGFDPINEEKYETKGSFQLWFEGNKITTRYVKEQHYTGGGGSGIEQISGGNIYDGKLLSRKPQFNDYENWFEQVIRWTGPRPQDKDIAEMKKLKNVSLNWSIIDSNEGKQIKLVGKNLNDGYFGVNYYGMSKGYNLIRKEYYNSDEKLYSLQTRKLKKIGDGWFPVEVDMKSFDTTDGKVELNNHFVLDLNRCSFNEPDVLPKGIFDFSTVKEHEQLNKIIEKYTKNETTYDDNMKSACDSVSNYITAVMSKQDEEAAKFAYPESSISHSDDNDQMREILKGQQVQLIAVYADDWNALVTSSVILADHGRIGSMVFQLKRIFLEQKEYWLINDIDIETIDSIEEEYDRFLKENSDAKTFMLKPPVSISTNPGEDKKDSDLSAEAVLEKVRQAQRPYDNMQIEWNEEIPGTTGGIIAGGAPPQIENMPILTKRKWSVTLYGNRSRLQELQESYYSRDPNNPGHIQDITYAYDGILERQLEKINTSTGLNRIIARIRLDSGIPYLFQQELFGNTEPQIFDEEKIKGYLYTIKEGNEPDFLILDLITTNQWIRRHTIDKSKGYNIIKYECIRNNGTTDYEDIIKLKQYPNGLWFFSERERYRHNINNPSVKNLEEKVIVTNIKFGENIPSDTFSINYPEGTNFQIKPFDYGIGNDSSMSTVQPKEDQEIKDILDKSSVNGEEVFGPVIERTIYSLTQSKNCFIDFDTGNIFDLPKDLLRNSEHGDWFEQNGIDATIGTEIDYGRDKNTDLCGLATLHCMVIPVSKERWNKVTAQACNEAFAKMPLGQTPLMSAEVELPATYLFQTLDHRGILQILEAKNEGQFHLIKVRYKLIQNEKNSKSEQEETNNLFPQAYDFQDSQTISIGDKNIHPELHKKKNGYGEIPEFVVVIKSSGQELRLNIKSALFEPMFQTKTWYKVINTKPLTLCITNPSGGNAWNAKPWYVIRLESNSSFKNIGQVSGIRDVDKDGIDDLVKYEDIWENGLGWFSHADSPGAEIYYKIENNELVPDTAKNIRIWNDEINVFNQQINTLSQRITKNATADIVQLKQRLFYDSLLHSILGKFLRYRLLGESEQGWEQLRKDLSYLDDEYFFFTVTSNQNNNSKIITGKFPIKEIEDTIKKSLENTDAEKWQITENSQSSNEQEKSEKLSNTQWGKSVEGVQVRLQADKTMWKAGEIPKLKADVRNNGTRELLIYRTDQLCELSVDSQLYQQKEVHAKSSPFPPGKQYDGIDITLDKRWYKNGGDESLQLSPGKHIIQVTFTLNDSRNSDIEPAPTPVIVKSNPVEIEILPDEAQSEYKKTLPSGVEVELIGMCEYPSMGKKWYKPDGGLLENPPYDESELSILSVHYSDSVPIEFAFRLTGDLNEPAWEAQVKTDDSDFVWWTGRRSKNGEYVRDIKSIGMFVKSNQESINLKLGFAIDGKSYEWAEFNNISVKNIIQANDNVQSQIKRIKSAQNMKQLGLAVFMYAQDHGDKLPETLDVLKPYFSDEQVYQWILGNIKYIGEGTLRRANSANIPIAFDYKLQDSNSTNFLFLDGHVDFQPIENYQDFLVSKKQVLIKMTYLEVTENVLKETLIKELQNRAGINADPNSQIIATLDDSQQAAILQAIQESSDSKVLAAPAVLVFDNQQAAIAIVNKLPFVTGFTEPINSDEKAAPIIEQRDIGITSTVKPHLTPDNKNFVIELKLENSKIIGNEERVFNGKYKENVPKIWQSEMRTSVPVPAGKIILINAGDAAPETENKSGSQHEKKKLLIMLEPAIIQVEQLDNQNHVDNIDQMDMIGPPANEFIINTSENTQPVKKQEKPENISGLQWGQDVNGLRASVEFIPDKESYSLGERIGIRFNIQNISRKEIQIAYAEQFDSYAEITNSRGEDVSRPSTSIERSGWPRVNRNKLKPNEIITLNNFGLGFGRQDDPALVKEIYIDPNDYTTREYNQLEPDQYSIQYKISLPNTYIKSIYEENNVPLPDDWKGTLQTQVKKINLTERQPANPKRFELVLEKQSIKQAVNKLAQKYKARICFEEIENTGALNPNQSLLTGDFFAPTLSEFLNKLTANGLYDWDKINDTYVVYPKAGSILKYPVKQIFLSFSSLGDPLKEIIRQAPEGIKFDFKIDRNISLPTYGTYTLNISEYNAMYALCRTLELTNKCIIWTLTHNNGNHLITLDYFPPAPLNISDDKEILTSEKPNDIKNNTGSDTVLNIEENIFRSLEQPETQLLKTFFSHVDGGIKSLKDNYPQLANWDKEKTETAGLITGKEIKNTWLTYYNASFPEKSPGSRDWCEKNGCYIHIRLDSGIESPYMNTKSFPLTADRSISVLATVITGNPESLELEQKINEIITLAAASVRQNPNLQTEDKKVTISESKISEISLMIINSIKNDIAAIEGNYPALKDFSKNVKISNSQNNFFSLEFEKDMGLSSKRNPYGILNTPESCMISVRIQDHIDGQRQATIPGDKYPHYINLSRLNIDIDTRINVLSDELREKLNQIIFKNISSLEELNKNNTLKKDNVDSSHEEDMIGPPANEFIINTSEKTPPLKEQETTGISVSQPDILQLLDENDKFIYNQLEQNVDLSHLIKPSMTFEQVLEEFRKLTVPPLKVQPNWRDLSEKANITPTTLSKMEPLRDIKIRTALEVLLAGLSSKQLRISYTIREGVILIATADSLPINLFQRVYDISDLVNLPSMGRLSGGMMGGMMSNPMGGYGSGYGVGGMMGGYSGYGGGMIRSTGSGYGGGMFGGYGVLANPAINTAQELKNLIMELIEPDSWHEKNDKAKGTIDIYPAENPAKMAVTNTIEVHQQIEKFLDSMRKGLGKQVSLEMRYIYASEQAINEILNNTGIEKIDNTILDDLQITSLLKAAQKNTNIKSIIVPRVTVLNGEIAQFESNDPANPFGISCRITPNITHDNNSVVIHLIQNIKDIKESTVTDKNLEINEYTTKTISMNRIIPNGKILGVSIAVNNQETSPGDKMSLIILIKPTIILQEEAEAMPGEESMGGSMIINSEAAPRRISGQSLNSQPQENTGQVLIETQVLHVSNEFLKHVELDANSFNKYDLWTKYRIKEPNEQESFVIDTLSAELLLKAIQERRGDQIVAGPKFLIMDGKQASINIKAEEFYLSKLDKATDPSIADSVRKRFEGLNAGTFINLTPAITKERNIKIDMKLNIRDFVSPSTELKINDVIIQKGRTLKEKEDTSKEKPAALSVFEKSLNTLIPDGQTLLILGPEITKSTSRDESHPLIGLPILDRLFRIQGGEMIRDGYTILILIKPIIVSH